jgi:Lrp/AsnC family leucine-responsive transcriptional regulator
MSKQRVDEIDRKLLEILQEHARTKRSELAEAVGLSIPAVSERLKKLETLGILTGFHARVEPASVGLEVTAFVLITAESSRFFDQIVSRAMAHDEILECHAITGEGSHLLKTRTRSTTSLENLLSEIQSWPGVVTTRTMIVLSSNKERSFVPLTYMLR